MKKKEVALAIFLLTGLTLQAQERVTQYKVRDAIEVRTPHERQYQPERRKAFNQDVA